jgi:predicted HAD superfamily Cof-like phosphohydrolase
MRRRSELQDLSRDHHVVLLHARRLRGDDRRVAVEKERAAFLRYRDAVLVHHLAEEQELLAFVADADLRDAVRRDHDAVLKAASYVEVADETGLRLIGETLRAHARLAEEQVFEHLQKTVVDDDAWMALARATSGLRRRLRPTAGPDEACFL